MSTITFRASACPSYWTLFLFYFTIPTIPDAWRNWLSSYEHSRPTIYAVLLTFHRSIKTLYGLFVWLLRLPSGCPPPSKPSSELARAFQDALNHQISHARSQKMFRDDDADDDPAREESSPLLASTPSHDQQQSAALQNDLPALSNLVVSRVSWIIKHSKQLKTTQLAITSEGADPKELAEAIVAIKNINPIFCPTLVECLTRIQLASRTRATIIERSGTAYKPELHQHKFKEVSIACFHIAIALLKLLRPNQDFDTLPPKGWQEVCTVSFLNFFFVRPREDATCTMLIPSISCTSCLQKSKIGFQGVDPSTDLQKESALICDEQKKRLDALLVFATYFGPSGREVVTEAVEGGPSWYPWALASINITWWCIKLIKKEELEYFLLSPAAGDDAAARCERRQWTEGLRSSEVPRELWDFLVLQAQLTFLFHRYWIALSPRPSVMQFESLFKIFTNSLHPALSKGLVGALGFGWALDPTAPDFAVHQRLLSF
ncbi:hypothetical protein VP01_2179g2 [Puccinia sorghi]|uniref:ELMO domain-containing protein n=1 Tax=Puccinia sorghi TaxID=27349 RepID=A0A0L6VA02_9BASI|nr:hypothetical protein VP01_2179g2 [Puccinia sorghi]